MGNYLKSLCVTDNILIVGLCCLSVDVHWQNNLSIPKSYINDVTCKIAMYTTSVGVLSTGLILASATVERFLVVAFPLKFRSSNSSIIGTGLISGYFIFSMAVSVGFAIGGGMSPLGAKCGVSDKIYESLVNITHLVAHVIVSIVLCGGVILIFTFAIIICLFRQKRKRNELMNSSNSQKEFQITAMLVTVTCLFIILRFREMIFVQISLVHPQIYIKVASWSKLFMLLTIINHSVNFFMYLIFLESFKKHSSQCF